MFSDSEAETAVSAGEEAEKNNEASLSVAAFVEQQGVRAPCQDGVIGEQEGRHVVRTTGIVERGNGFMTLGILWGRGVGILPAPWCCRIG